MVQVDSLQTLTFDLAPQTRNKQYTRFVFPPPPPSSTTTQRRHVTTHCQQPPMPMCTADRSQPTPTRTTMTTMWQRQATNPSSTRPRLTTMPPTRAPRYHRQWLPPTTITGHPHNDNSGRQPQGKAMECAGNDVATCHIIQMVMMLAIVQTVTMLAIVTVCICS